jgi:CRISPR-associated exonuclease Cas4
MLDDDSLLTVTDLKQYDYCARVVFYERCLPHVRPRTHKMDVGRDAHVDEEGRARQRSMAAYGGIVGECAFDVALACPHLGLRGKLDELVTQADGTRFPVDYKLSRQVNANHRLQLAAYAMLIEAVYGGSVVQGYIVLIGQRKTERVEITPHLRVAVETRLKALREMIAHERMPDPTGVRSRCYDCEFRRFCNDV